MTPGLDIAACRARRNYSRTEWLGRVLWAIGCWLLRLSPRPCFGWRRFVLRCFGARLGAHVHVYPDTRIYFPWNLSVGEWSAIGEGVLIYNLGRVDIGRQVTISHGAHLCAGTHDHHSPSFPLLRKPIQVQDQAWICADAFIGPGVRIAEGAVVGARAVVITSVSAWEVVAGNPARRVGVRDLAQAQPVELPALR